MHHDEHESHRQYLLTIGLTAAMSWAAWIIVILKLDPYESTGMALGLFFVSLFFALIGTFTLLGFGMRRWLSKQEVYYHHLTVSLRQGLLLSICTVLSTVLLILGLLTWWNGLLLVTVAVLIELYLTSKG